MARLSIEKFRAIEAAVIAAGYGAQIAWFESQMPPTDAESLASEVIYVIINGGMHNKVARIIFDRCMVALQAGESCCGVYGHPGKAPAIDLVWQTRAQLFFDFTNTEDLIAFCAALPFIGKVTKYHIARNLGGNYAKPDVHLNRLADREGVTAQELCDRLAKGSGYRAGTVDMILWRACADGIINPKKKKLTVRPPAD
ncbi:hypothetical protein [Sphingomonas bacterium]|uniref:hypothetical protein n=1 Tax=Sphingomonas bacterium TaxID=1895847 RepID=UPI001576BD4E|nr:hypothetical protein [Sphingomonas bacterium]